MGGTFDANRVACVGAGRGGGGSSSSYDAAAAAEAERQRQEQERRRHEELLRSQEEERLRREAEERKRQQEEFERGKQKALQDLKGITEELGLKGVANSDNFGLKGLDEPGAGLKKDSAPKPPRWDEGITDPQITTIARRLDAVVPPPPLPSDEVALNWKEIYLGDNRLLKSSDYAIAVWEMTGLLGESFPFPYKSVLIAGKTLIAGEDGAYLHLVKREQDYEAALRYLKDPAQSQKFARLVKCIHDNRPLPAGTTPLMAKAARAITDPALGNSSTQIALDSMLSKEAVSAMIRKATVELVSEKLSSKFEGLLNDLNGRKELFEAVRLERQRMQQMMSLAAVTPQQRAEVKIAMDHANQLSASIYRFERVRGAVDGLDMGMATDKLADFLMGAEAAPQTH
jgi:hypothetical protein